MRVIITFFLSVACLKATYVVVTDTVRDGSGNPIPSGSIYVTPNSQFTCSNGDQIYPVTLTPVPIRKGVFTVTLCSNTNATPTNTSYSVKIVPSSVSGSAIAIGGVTPETWVVTTTNPSHLSDVRTSPTPIPSFLVNVSQIIAGMSGYCITSNGIVASWGPVCSGPGGSNTQFQYNNGGVLGGTTGLTFNNSSGQVTGALAAPNFATYNSLTNSYLFNTGAFPLNLMFGFNTAPVLQGLVGAINASGTGNVNPNNAFGVSGYGMTSRQDTAAVGGYFQGTCNGTLVQCFGLNVTVNHTGVSVAGSNEVGLEVDTNHSNSGGNAAATIKGITSVANLLTQPSGFSNAFEAIRGPGSNFAFNNAYYSRDGSASVALYAGQAVAGTVSTQSQNIQAESNDGVNPHQGNMFLSPGGNWVIRPDPAANFVVDPQNNNSNPFGVLNNGTIYNTPMGGSGVRCAQVDNSGIFSKAVAGCGSGALKQDLGSISTTLPIDGGNGTVKTITATALTNLTCSTPVNVVPGQLIELQITQDAMGGRTLTCGSITNLGTPNAVASQTDYKTFTGVTSSTLDGGDGVWKCPTCPPGETFPGSSSGSTFVHAKAAASGDVSFPSPSAPSTLTYTVAIGTASLTTGALAGNTCGSTVTISATGVATTDVVDYTPNANLSAAVGYGPLSTDGLKVYPFPTTNNVNFVVCNATALSTTIPAVTLNWAVRR